MLYPSSLSVRYGTIELAAVIMIVNATLGLLCVARPAIKNIFQSISAKVGSEPCCDWVSISPDIWNVWVWGRV